MLASRRSNRRAGRLVVALVLISAAARGAATGGDAASRAILPAERPWSGASLSRVAAADDPWRTPAEASEFVATPSYAATTAWLERLAAARPEVRLVEIGRSFEGRASWMAVVSREGAATPEALAANGRPTLLAHGAIHAGEIDGKDAGLMLLRELAGGQLAPLLARANLLFVPILNVDGHERSSPFTRINQRGPAAAGWRTNARNLNLNRDFMKLDAPETRAVVAAIERFRPDLYADLHVTDGADYAADVTFGWTRRSPFSPAIERFLEERLRPAAERDLAAAGHVPGPLALVVDETDIDRGILDWNAEPRFSNGYGALRHLPTVLVETHSLKPYRQRVLGTLVLLESMLATLAEHGAELRAAVAADRARRVDPVPIAFAPFAPSTPSTTPPRTIPFAAVEGRVRTSEISGGPVVDWGGAVVRREIPLVAMDAVTAEVRRPIAYWIPPAYPEIVERLRVHGIQFEIVAEPRKLAVEMLRFGEPKLAATPFEGRVPVEVASSVEHRRERFAAGSVRVPTDQPLGDLAIALLEPAAPDSLFRWGFLLDCLQRTEYAEAYVIEPMARAMLAEDPALAAEFAEKLATDAAFAADSQARLDFFYRRTPFHDPRERLYPIAREVE